DDPVGLAFGPGDAAVQAGRNRVANPPHGHLLLNLGGSARAATQATPGLPRRQEESPRPRPAAPGGPARPRSGARRTDSRRTSTARAVPGGPSSASEGTPPRDAASAARGRRWGRDGGGRGPREPRGCRP